MISFLKCICWFCYSLNIFSNQIDHYCLISINYFLRNGAKRSQKRTFVRRQWAQYLLFLLFTQHLFQSFWLLLLDVNHYFLTNGALNSPRRLLLEDSGHSICCFCSSLNIFFNQFDHYCLTSINYFLRNEARNSQKQTFDRRQWAQHLLFFVLLLTSFPINLIMIVCSQSIFSQK